MTKVRIVLFLTIAIFLSACNGKEMNLTDGDKQVTQAIDDVISDYIVEKTPPPLNYPAQKSSLKSIKSMGRVKRMNKKVKAWLEKQES